MDDQDLACLMRCGRFARFRGLCDRHYKALQERVRRGEATWAELEAAGRCRPARPRGEWMAHFGRRR